MEDQISTSLNRLEKTGCQYAFYFHEAGKAPVFRATCHRFPSASLIKVPILLAWAHLEQSGALSRDELCDLDSVAQVEGAGFSWLLRARRLPFQDVLLLMIALSDNLCTNLVIDRIGRERLNDLFRNVLGLRGVELQRRMMDFEARRRGEENWITAQDCIRLFELVAQRSPLEKAWVEPMLLVNQDSSLLMRDLARDQILFYHKTGSLEGILHDWGYTDGKEIFLLTKDVADESIANEVFGSLGRLLA